MPEFRRDPIVGRWVIIATERAKRPSDVVRPHESTPARLCPFCPGHEDKTPREVYVSGRPPSAPPNGPGWKVRVVPNRYPALMIEGELHKEGDGIYDKMNGVGAHEVIIESPDHKQGLAELSERQVEDVLWSYRDRIIDLRKDTRFKYVLIFKNHGPLAGATLDHPHTQLIATPVTPRAISVELESAWNHYHVKERCIFCDMLAQELDKGERVVSLDEHFVALAPYASRFPFETMLIPRRHLHSFADEPRSNLVALARCIKDFMVRLKTVLRDPPYNFVFHTAPNTETLVRRRNYWDTLPVDFHWHIEVLPRLTKVAGFEWGTGFYVNPTAPEEAAAFLRDARV